MDPFSVNTPSHPLWAHCRDRFLAVALPGVLMASSTVLAYAPGDDGPVNDLCENALEIEDGSHVFTTLEAETDGPDESLCSTFGSEQIWNDIWYRYTAPIDGTLVISTCDSVDFDSRIAIYTGGCADLVEHACNDDGTGCADYSSLLVTNCTEGVDYLIRIGGYAEGGGSGSFGVKASEGCAYGCAPEDQGETEPCGESLNGGCAPGQGQPPEVEPISLGSPLCGSWFVEDGFRDTDYYRVEVPEPGGGA